MTARRGPSPVRGLVVALAVGHLLAQADRMIFSAAAPLLAAEFALTDTQLGMLLGPAFAVVYGVAALAFGNLADRGHGRALILGGFLVWSAASALTGLVGGFGAIVATRALLGLGQAAFIPAALALLVDAGGADRRASSLAAFTLGSSIGRTGALLVAGLLLTGLSAMGLREGTQGWRALFLVTILPNLAIGGWLLRMRWPVATGVRLHGTVGWMRLRWRVLLPYFVAAVAPIVVGQSLAVWLPTLAMRGHALSAGEAARAVGVLTLLGAPLGQVAGGWLMARSETARREPMLVIVILLCAALPMLAMTGATRGWQAGIGVTGATVALGIASFAGLYGLQALVPAARRGFVNGVLLAMVTLVGAGLGPLLTGVLSDAGGNLGTVLLRIGIGAAVVAGAAALVVGRGYARAVGATA